MLKQLVVLWISICLLACTAPQAKFVGAEQIAQGIHVGDKVALRTKKGERYDFTVTAIDKKIIFGQDSTTRYKVAISEIKFIETRDVSPGRSIGAGAMVIAGAFTALVIVAVIALLSWDGGN